MENYCKHLSDEIDLKGPLCLYAGTHYNQFDWFGNMGYLLSKFLRITKPYLGKSTIMELIFYVKIA